MEWMPNLEMAFDESPTIKLGNQESTVWLFVDLDPNPDSFVVPVLFVVLVLVTGELFVFVPVVGVDE